MVFVGAGLSAAAGLPTWGGLLRLLVDEVKASTSPEAYEDLQGLLDRRRYLDVAEYCREMLGPTLVGERIRRAVATPNKLPRLHQLLVRLPFAAAVTTNYDLLLETAYAAAGRVERIETHKTVDGSLLYDGSFFILKAHGTVHGVSSLVLTARDYIDIMNANPAFEAVMSAILLTRPILFLGYSLDDPDFRLLLGRQLATFKDVVPLRYAVMGGLNDVERYVLRKSTGVQVLPYPAGEHHHVEDFLIALSKEVHGEPEVELSAEASTAPNPSRAAAGGDEIENSGPARLHLMVQDGALLVEFNRQGRTWASRGLAAHEVISRLVSALAADPGVFQWQHHLGGEVGSHIKRIGEVLQECLPGPTLDLLDQLEPDSHLVLRLAPDLEAFPWEWLILGDEPLTRRFAVVRQLEAGWPAPKAPAGPPRALLVGDTRSDLPGALSEIRRLVDLYPNCVTLEQGEATFGRVVEALSAGVDVFHFAGHGWADEFDSYLALADGAVLRARELRPLIAQSPPRVIVLNTHYTAFVPAGGLHLHEDTQTRPAVGNTRGFAGVAAAVGVGGLLGCFGEPLDQPAEVLGSTFHKRLVGGDDCASAFHSALKAAAALSIEGDASWMQYALFGQPDLRLSESGA